MRENVGIYTCMRASIEESALLNLQVNVTYLLIASEVQLTAYRK